MVAVRCSELSLAADLHDHPSVLGQPPPQNDTLVVYRKVVVVVATLDGPFVEENLEMVEVDHVRLVKEWSSHER